jgi:hypothetical protein
MRKSLPKEYKWEAQGAKREKKKGSAPRGIMTGVNWGLKKSGKNGKEEGCIERKVHMGNKK